MSEPVSSHREIRSVLLPVGTRPLLLPNAAVAEVIAYQSPHPDSGAPDWWLGQIEWRGRRVPVVSFEEAVGLPAPARGARERIVVLNTLNGNPDLPYVGLYTAGIARLVRVSIAGMEEADPSSVPASPLILGALLLNGQPAWIPDLDALESMVLELGPSPAR